METSTRLFGVYSGNFAAACSLKRRLFLATEPPRLGSANRGWDITTGGCVEPSRRPQAAFEERY
jgi:hypothetical protein